MKTSLRMIIVETESGWVLYGEWCMKTGSGGSLNGVSGVQNSNRTFQTYMINTTIPKVASQKNDCNLWTKRSV